MNATELPPVCKIADVMDYFQLSRTTIYRLIKSGKIKSYKYGNKPRIKREWVLEYEAELVGSADVEEGAV
ncbi:excisionase family DNA binding protein [Paenibacillus sp. LBL]|uniref:helix-turn-helix domain-containing protein n=1 Tax=Paenibacillus sp. LBL TaxID=2940563 RepID=UPI0024760A5A|nr:helix-turn-helix domain-containing protein [Paenibacillus sp. LBL]MDH6670221.1 excisionase family DNA binding protein [Paenibacillus sp. LBL]